MAAKSYTTLRRALLDREKRSKQWLSRQVSKRIRRTPMAVKVAQAVVAHDEGIRVERYLAGQDLEDVRQAIRDLNQIRNGDATADRRAIGGDRSRPKGAVGSINFKGASVTTSDPFLPRAKLSEAREMADVYPLLYVLENSIRGVIRGVMRAKFGVNWWDTQILGGRLNDPRGKVARRRTSESSNSWHQRRGSHEIDYTDFDDLLTLAQSKPALFFPTLLGDVEWFKQFFRELVPSRNVVCHMNPLSGTNVADVKLKLKRWEEHLKNRRAELEAAMAAAAAGESTVS